MAKSSYQIVEGTIKRNRIENDGGNCKFIDLTGYSIKHSVLRGGKQLR